ncbi:Hydrogenobyrinate a,c-diamide synthase (fragment) [Methylocella tundrae]|uniref:Hydrogenobyrinate a,c-diamide synthase n=1 Tax=Methylocella tundrae TaxID=227605 RepID=A0A4U8Z110_METTU
MGLFDGVIAPPGRSGASADVAAALGWPVLLCVDVSGQAQSAAAVVKGCATYDSRINIAGVVLNRVASERHRRLAAQAIAALGVPVLGALPRTTKIDLPERHLGLVQAEEIAGLDALLDAIAAFVGAHCDLNAIGASARAGSFPEQAPGRRSAPASAAHRHRAGYRIFFSLSAYSGGLAQARRGTQLLFASGR